MVIENILILGIGGIGLHVAKRLIHEGYSVSIIDSDAKMCRYANENVEAHVVEGDLMEMNNWKRVNASSMDLLIAVTNNDATNMLSALIADRFGIKRKIVRVRSLDFGAEDSILSAEDLKVDLLIHPEEVISREVARLVKLSSATDITEIDGGEIQIVAIHVDEGSPLVGLQIKEIYSHLRIDESFRVVAIARGITTTIPSGRDKLIAHDQLFIMAKRADMPKIMELVGVKRHDIHRLMILGGGWIGRRIAELLENDFQVKLVERDSKRAELLASCLKNTQVLNGDGTDANTLALGGIPDMETFIATTGDNETNIISSLLAKHLMNKNNRDPNGGDGKTIALVDKEDYLVLASTIGLDIALNARLSAVNEILKFIRRSELISVAHLHGVDAEAIELVAAHNSTITKKPLNKLTSVLQQRGILIGAVRRDDEWQIALGTTQIRSDERTIVVCMSQRLKEVRRLFL